MVALNRWELHVARAPHKAARRLHDARVRLVELVSGEQSHGSDDTIDARQEEIDGLTAALAGKGIVICADCWEPLANDESRKRGVGPRCWAKRQKAHRAAELAEGRTP